MKKTSNKLDKRDQQKNNNSDKLTNDSPLVEHAIAYYHLGWSVVPVIPGKKVPYIKWKKHQQKRATPKKIREWWREHPDANIGIITGKISNLVVLDFDSLTALKIFRQAVSKTPRTIKQRTGRGYQYFFACPEDHDLRNKAGLIKNVDLRAEAGLVVVAPSIHKSGKRYKWENYNPFESGLDGLKRMSNKILNFCLSGSKSSKSNITKISNILDGVDEGTRDETLFRHACRLKNKGLSKPEVEVIITAVAKNCTPPFPKKEALAKVESAYGYQDPKALKIAKAREKMYEITSKKKGISVRKLMRTSFPEPNWAIKGVLCEGLNILGGKPKVGKSFLALNICMAIAHGELVLGEFETKKGSVICIAMEDTYRRLKYRLLPSLPTKVSDATMKLRLINEWPRMDDGGLDLLDHEIEKYNDLRLIVIDTLQWFRPMDKNKDSNSYSQDYDQMMQIKQLADKHRVAILLIHHLRKTGANDIFDTLSGSFGLTGGADGLLALDNKEGKYVLHVRGRDIDEQQWAMKFTKGNLSWSVVGPADEVRSTNQQQILYDALKDADGPVSPKELVAMTGLKENYVHKNMRKLVENGDAERLDRGKYQFIDKEQEES